MFSRKYLQDYKVYETIDINGRVKKEAVYVGGDYTILPALALKDKRLVAGLSVLSALTFLGALVPLTVVARFTYISVPFVFAGPPIYILIGSAYSLWREKDVMIREHAEKISTRMPPCSLIAALLAYVAFFGILITAFFTWDRLVAGDFIFCVFSLATAAATSVVFLKCRKLKAEKL